MRRILFTRKQKQNPQKNKAIESAAVATRGQIKRHADDFLRKSFRSFAITTGIKLLILARLWGLSHAGVFERRYFIRSVPGALAVFLIRYIRVTGRTRRTGV